MRDQRKGWETGRIERLLNGMIAAKDAGKRVYLVNTIWCAMKDDEWRPILKRLDGISAREPASQSALSRLTSRNDIEVHPDESYFLPVPEYNLTNLLTGDRIVGGIYPQNMTDRMTSEHRMFKDYARFSLMDRSWEDTVAALRGAKVYVTGQHHGVFAACKARCPFVVGRVNTHKLTSLFEWAGVRIPLFTCEKECREQLESLDERRLEFDKLFDFLEGQRPWTIPVT
jgi:hypothetical protein